jgi:hypothetical protein
MNRHARKARKLTRIMKIVNMYEKPVVNLPSATRKISKPIVFPSCTRKIVVATQMVKPTIVSAV